LHLSSLALGRLLAFARIAIGLTALVAPKVPATPWVGSSEAERSSVQLFARTLGARDLALGLGGVTAPNVNGNLRSWVLMGALADLCDAAATVKSFPQLPKISRWFVLASTIGAATVGAAVAGTIEKVA
jgi:hypothetical protein